MLISIFDKYSMQPKLFEKSSEVIDLENVILYALGDFQSRGKVLADRELAFDRLRGAFLRAFKKFGIPEPSEQVIVEILKHLGANVTEIPSYVAKRPYRITIPREVAAGAAHILQTLNN
jgi:hypothetical protein